MSTSPHKRRKGCGLCKPWKLLSGSGRKERDPISVVRKMGKTNYKRHEVPEGQDG